MSVRRCIGLRCRMHGGSAQQQVQDDAGGRVSAPKGMKSPYYSALTWGIIACVRLVSAPTCGRAEDVRVRSRPSSMTRQEAMGLVANSPGKPLL